MPHIHVHHHNRLTKGTKQTFPAVIRLKNNTECKAHTHKQTNKQTCKVCKANHWKKHHSCTTANCLIGEHTTTTTLQPHSHYAAAQGDRLACFSLFCFCFLSLVPPQMCFVSRMHTPAAFAMLLRLSALVFQLLGLIMKMQRDADMCHK